MASDWKPGRLRDIADIVMGQSPTADYVNEACQGKPLLNGPTEFGSMHPTPVQFTTDVRKKANPGDLLFCVRGSTTGRMNWADQEYAIGRGLAAIRHRDGDDFQHFVRAVIELKLPELLAAATGSTFPNVGRDQLLDIPASIPPKGEQRVISRFFKDIDDKIEINRRINQTLEAMAQAIFKSWFVDFEPVKAKIAAKQEGRDPLHAAMGAISGKPEAQLDALPPEQYEPLAATAALFPQEMEESELGEIPKGWSHKTLAQLTEKIGSGATPRGGKEVYLDEGVALIRSQNVYDSLFVWEGLVRISDKAATQLKGVTVQEDDVLLNITGASILRTCVVEPDALPARVNQHVAIIRAKEGIPPRFIHMHLLRPDIKGHLFGLNAGASREAITKSHIESLTLLTPGPELLGAFQTATSPLFRQVQRFGQQIRMLGELRDTLLPKLLSGELSVAAIAPVLEATP